ncbi:MAG TPA: YHS domain-containing protein [Chthonomonadaceae bacterium]|nr:YHS domain-containing protein [Chthonomonadaceae bacterium]
MFSRTRRAFGRALLAAFACAAVVLPASVRAEDAGSYACPVLGTAIDKVTDATKSSDYKGVRYYFCCDMCKPQFDKDQAKFLNAPKNKGKVIGVALFDPVTTKRLDAGKATAHSDYSGVRYFFAKADDKATFDKDPKKYVAAPKKDLLYCPVSDTKVDSYADASDYSDYKGTRYYFCCAGCKPQFDQNPDKYLNGIENRVKAADRKKDAKP